MAIPRSFLSGINLNSVLQLSSSAGTSGQMLISQGAGAAPVWTSSPNLNNPLLTSISTVGGGGGEGGQINFARVTDGASYWYIDSFGTTASPDLRIVESATERWRFIAQSSGLYSTGSATIAPISSTSTLNLNLTGGANTSTISGAVAGGVIITGGLGGSGVATAQYGGSITITGGGTQGNTSGIGGSVTIRGGAGNGSNGSITIGDANTSSVSIGGAGISTTVAGTLTSNGVHYATTTQGNHYGTSFDIYTYSGIGTSTTGAPIMMTCASTSTRYHVGFSVSGTRVGGISTATTTTTYSTTSDYRLKENIQPVPDAINRLLQLNPIRFTWKNHPEFPAVDGFLAHEAQEVVPESVTGVKDEIDEEGNPAYQGIDQSKLVPLLTAALQDAIKKIDSLEERLAILENK